MKTVQKKKLLHIGVCAVNVRICVCVCACSYIGIDFGVAHSKWTLFVKQDSTVSRALKYFLLSFITPRDGGVGFLITPINTNAQIDFSNQDQDSQRAKK